jgi:hypothetical protein
MEGFSQLISVFIEASLNFIPITSITRQQKNLKPSAQRKYCMIFKTFKKIKYYRYSSRDTIPLRAK